MNFSSITGILLAVIVFFGAALTSTDDFMIFMDYHAILLVFGGTIAATLIGFKAKTVLLMLRLFIKRVLGRDKYTPSQMVKDVVKLAEGYRKDPNYIKQNLNTIQSPFLKEALELNSEGGIKPSVIDGILHKRAIILQIKHEDEADIFRTMSRFPPAFGLLGAVLGIINLMQSLGGADAFKMIGPALAVALVATLYGIAFANLVLLPIAENLTNANKEDKVKRQIVLDAVKLLRQKEHPLVVEEHLKSYLAPTERNKMTEEQEAA